MTNNQTKKNLQLFSREQIYTVGDAAALAEELVSNAYKMPACHWLRHRYDVKTLAELSGDEIADGPFAQIVRYKVRRSETTLESDSFDFYKVCLQDHAILAAMAPRSQLRLFPFALYILCHELVHIVRFARFLQSFDASCENMAQEETRVHKKTREIIKDVRVSELEPALRFFQEWHETMDTVL